MTQDLLRENLDDLGIDLYSHIDEKAPRPLFPPLPHGTKTPLYDLDSVGFEEQILGELKVLDSLERIYGRYLASPLHLKRKLEDRLTVDSSSSKGLKGRNKVSNDTIPRTHLKERIPNYTAYFPREILEEKSVVKAKKKKIDLTATEESKDGTAKGTGEGEEEEEEEEKEEEEDGEMSDNDYAADYVNSDNEGYGDDDDGGGEATF